MRSGECLMGSAFEDLISPDASSKTKVMLTDEPKLDFVRRAAAELAVCFTDPRDHNLHAVINGMIEAIEVERDRISALEARVRALESGAKETASQGR